MIDRLTQFAATLRSLAEKRRRWRLPLLILGLAIFLGGCIWSVARLDIAAEDIRWQSMALLALVLAPLGLVYAAANMMVTARAARVEMDFARSFRVASLAQVAEVLPLPGGALVRTAALVQGGAKASHSAGHVLANALIWIACAAIAAGLSLAHLGMIPLLLAAVGAVILVVSLVWLTRYAGVAIAAISLFLRLFGLLLVAVRLFVAFAALSLVVAFPETLVFAFASIAGSAASIAPAGLGISEGLAAIFAQATSSVPAAAFIAVGLNRLMSLLVAGLASAILTLAGSRPSPLSE